MTVQLSCQVMTQVSLQDLSLAGNQLTELPDDIGNLQSLKRLQLSGNYLQRLPDSICNLTALQVLPSSVPLLLQRSPTCMHTCPLARQLPYQGCLLPGPASCCLFSPLCLAKHLTDMTVCVPPAQSIPTLLTTAELPKPNAA